MMALFGEAAIAMVKMLLKLQMVVVVEQLASWSTNKKKVEDRGNFLELDAPGGSVGKAQVQCTAA